MICTKNPKIIHRFTMSFTRLAPLAKVSLMALLVIGSQSHARTEKPKPNQYLLSISDTEYKLALAQALSEVCPSMLTVKQQAQFDTAYHNQIRLFMPNANPKEVMQELSGKQAYQIALKDMRNWTASFPPSENKALCQEFAQSSVIF